MLSRRGHALALVVVADFYSDSCKNWSTVPFRFCSRIRLLLEFLLVQEHGCEM